MVATLEPVNATIRSITVPGVLLQGDRIDLILETDPPGIVSRGGKLEITAKGLSTQTAGTMVDSADAGAGSSASIVRLIAAVDAAPGVYAVAIKLVPPGGARPPAVENASVIVRALRSVRPRDDRIELAKGKAARIAVGIVREPGFNGPVEIKLDLPEGVSAMGRTTIAANNSAAEFPLMVADDFATAAEVKITAVARMPRGPVRVESAIRPKLVPSISEKKD